MSYFWQKRVTKQGWLAIIAHLKAKVLNQLIAGQKPTSFIIAGPELQGDLIPGAPKTFQNNTFWPPKNQSLGGKKTMKTKNTSCFSIAFGCLGYSVAAFLAARDLRRAVRNSMHGEAGRKSRKYFLKSMTWLTFLGDLLCIVMFLALKKIGNILAFVFLGFWLRQIQVYRPLWFFFD